VLTKKKLKTALSIYIMLMIILVFSSKTIYNLSIPRVAVTLPQSGRLIKEIEAYGFIEYADTFSSFAETAGQIDEVLVQVGDSVQKGKPIARYRANDTNETPFILRSLGDGIVTAIHAENGAFTNPGDCVASMGVDNKQFTANFSCTVEEGSFIEQGDDAALFITGIGKVAATVEQMSLSFDGRLNVKLVFETDSVMSGQYVKIVIQKRTQIYDIIVPNEAVITEGMHHYIWAVQSRQGALGTEYFSIKTRVIIADADDYNTAIAKGLEMVVPAAPVVVSSDKTLMANGRVRRME